MSHILYLSLTPSRRVVVEGDLDCLVANGHAVTMVTLKPGDWPNVDPRVVFIGLHTDEQRHTVLRAERALVFRAPDLALRGTRKVVSLAQKLPVGQAQTASARRHVGMMMKHQPARSRWFHSEKFLPNYSKVRPYLLWRVADRKLQDQVTMESVDLVVVAEPLAVPIGYRLAKRHENLPVTFELDREEMARSPGPI